MKLLLITLAAFTSVASADKGTDYPHRDWGQVATLAMTAVDATACIARALDRRGDVLVIPVEGGSDIDFAVRPMWGPKMEPWERFHIRSEGDTTTMRMSYRHPITQTTAGKDVARLQRDCLKIASIVVSPSD